MKIRGFPAHILERNLNLPLSPLLDLPNIRTINVAFGDINCKTRPALNVLYITQLPRFKLKYPKTEIKTSQIEGNSRLTLEFLDGIKEKINVPLDNCSTDAEILNQIRKSL